MRRACARFRWRPPNGIALHTTRRLTADEVTVHDGIPVTTPGRTLLDLADVLTQQQLRAAMKEAENLRLDVKIEPLNGRRGTSALIAEAGRYQENGMTADDLEAAFLAICERAGFPSPIVDATIEGHQCDFVWPKHRLIIETDGRAAHLTPHAFEDDRARDALLTTAGWRVVRITYRQITFEPEAVAATIKRLLA